MLAVSPLKNRKDEKEIEVVVEKFCIENDEFYNSDLSGEILLASIDFDDLFVGINDGDLLRDLELDPDNMLAELISVSTSTTGSGGEESAAATVSATAETSNECERVVPYPDHLEKSGGEEIARKQLGVLEDSAALLNNIPNNPSQKEASDKGTKPSSAQSKNSQGKRKVKVDWTPDLHRRFVQAVEQLGLDKAIPSKILELMGIDCLTRHNVASHLQKYRSHRKHLLAREADAASWNHKSQVYGVSSIINGGGSKKDVRNPCLTPTMGFPPMAPLHHFRPLHVWGHPFMDQKSMQFVCPKHLAPSTSPPLPPPPQPAAWHPAPPYHPPTPPRDPSFWHSHLYQVRNSLTAGTPCFPPPLAPMRFQTPPVPGIPPPHAMYKVTADPGIGVPSAVRTGHTTYPHPPNFDCHPSRESIDEAIGDVLSKPWLPLPLGLKSPSTDGVVVELHSQGVSKIPPSTR